LNLVKIESQVVLLIAQRISAFHSPHAYSLFGLFKGVFEVMEIAECCVLAGEIGQMPVELRTPPSTCFI
jgi:hypothetical protein